jgi:putative membrane protein
MYNLRALSHLAAALLAVPLLTACAASRGAAAPATGATAAQARSPQDGEFLACAARDGLAEVRLAKLAAEKATDPQVKDLAQVTLADFEKSNDHLRQVAARLGVALPADLDRQQRWDYTSLARLDGMYFHRYYVNMMAEYHVKEVREYRHEVGTSGDAALRQYAAATLPALKADREKAQQLVGFWGQGRTYGGDDAQ